MKRILVILLLATPAFALTFTFGTFIRNSFIATVTVVTDNKGVITSVTVDNKGSAPCTGSLIDVPSGTTISGTVGANSTLTKNLSKPQQIYTVDIATGQAGPNTDVQGACQW